MANRNETELIVVPGHGVCKQGCTNPDAVRFDSSWVGIFPGEGPFLAEHAKRGVYLAARTEESLLVFSGGQTRENAGRRSEAESYREIAEAAGWWGLPSVSSRIILEEYARESFENLLFAVALFKKETDHWPMKVTICGWRFKERRYDLIAKHSSGRKRTSPTWALTIQSVRHSPRHRLAKRRRSRLWVVTFIL